MSEPENTALKQIETALRDKINEIENIADPGERLLQYTALKKACEGAYDRSKAKKQKDGEKSKYIKDGEMAGSILGISAGAAAATAVIVVSGALTAGFGTIVGATFFALGSGMAGEVGGNAFRKFSFKRRNPDKVPHATKMYDMNCEIDSAIQSLSSSSVQNVENLSHSPRFDEIKVKFPAIGEVFNEQATLKAGREALLKATAPAPKKTGPAI